MQCALKNEKNMIALKAGKNTDNKMKAKKESRKTM
jgi:hypothetical protein